MIGLDDFSDAVRETFSYDDGVLRWRISPSRNKSAGDAAGSPNQRGYIQVQWGGKLYTAHKLIYVYHHGWMPEVVDHIDGNVRNNRVDNLRAATKSQNQHNAKRRSDSSSGFKNVRKYGKKWQVVVFKNCIRHHIGTFSDIGAASEAAANARRRLHGKFARDA